MPCRLGDGRQGARPYLRHILLDADRTHVLDAHRGGPASHNAAGGVNYDRLDVGRAQIQPEEAECIFQVNRLRALLGLRVLRTDVRLCTAARDHSTDMKTKGFFNHISPVPGKRKFSDRAKLAGTTACAENIHEGQRTPAGATREWFISPPHFKVMLHDIHKRIGVGHVRAMWTQMFGY